MFSGLLLHRDKAAWRGAQPYLPGKEPEQQSIKKLLLHCYVKQHCQAYTGEV